MVEISGKTVYELAEQTTLGDGFMFLGCDGPSASYSTYRVAYTTLMTDLSDVFMNGLAPDISERLDRLENEVSVGDGTIYLRKNSPVTQQVSADVIFDGSAKFNGAVQATSSVQFYDGGSVSGYSVTLPKDTFRNLSGNGASFRTTDASRVVTSSDVSAALEAMQLAQEPVSEQIMKTDWPDYLANGVAITPSFTNKNYVLDGTFSATFYRYAGIKQDMSGACSESAYDEREDGVVFKQIANKYAGIPLTKSYRNFRTLTVVCLEDSTPTSSVGAAKKLHSMTIQTADIDVALQYVKYKERYRHLEMLKYFFDTIDDRWYFGGNNAGGLMYLSTKTNIEFSETFLPLMFTTNGYCVVAVFGRT